MIGYVSNKGVKFSELFRIVWESICVAEIKDDILSTYVGCDHIVEFDIFQTGELSCTERIRTLVWVDVDCP